MRKVILFLTLFVSTYTLFAQDFYIKCSFSQKYIPRIYYNHDNVFDDLDLNFVAMKKDSDSTCSLRLTPQRISFAKIGGDPLLICAGEMVEGLFSQTVFYPNDSGTINFKLKQIGDGFSAIVNEYPVGEGFGKFKTVFGLLSHYLDSTEKELNLITHRWGNEGVIIALKEYLSTRLAHFLVLPVLFHNKYDRNELNSLIKRNVRIKYPEYWLQIEAGRIFIETYYRKLILPIVNYDFQKSLKNNFLIFPQIRKLAAYHYFLECMKKGLVKTKNELLEDYKDAKNMFSYSNTEQSDMRALYEEIGRIGKPISKVFATLPLQDVNGKMLGNPGKQKLVAGEDIILDFWASWCVPCKEKMRKVNSDHIFIDGKKYRIIFLSLDQDQKSWMGVRFEFLNISNSFRITKFTNDFFKEFDVRLIPRYMLIDKSLLLSASFEY